MIGDGLIGAAALPRALRNQLLAQDFFIDGADLSAIANMPRRHAGANNTTAATGVMQGGAHYLPAGFVISKVAMCTAATALGTPTNWWIAVYDPSGNLVCSTADQLTTAWAGNTAKDIAIARDSVGGAISSFTTLVAGVYTVAVMFAGAIMPTFRGGTAGSNALGSGLVAGQSMIGSTSGAGLTTTPPATFAAPAVSANQHYAVVH